MHENQSTILIYQTEDGVTKIETRLLDETVWLTQAQLGDLFQKSKSTISEHLKNIFLEGELNENSTVRKFRTVQTEGTRNVERDIEVYNLDVIISVGYRVKSHRGTQFRIWATQRLKEYLIKGFTMNDDLLKQVGGGNYFDELLARIRDIRSSEKVFWRKVLDIYSTSIDYDPTVETSQNFFKTIQNKMHWAAHGNTAAEIIYKRIDATKPNLGLTNFKGEKPTQQETEIAKNYLNEKELNLLNRIVTAYLEFAELQALNQKPMYMKDWIERLDDFLKMSGQEILNHLGTISHDKAIEKAKLEFEKFKELTKNELSKVEKDFINQIESTTKKLKK
ncbi:MAG: virulence RhuM family protein [Flavobacterium sp.]|uniref:virulence RhuM family protein n=1 Tax=Flavobacterium sp. TaxID=239 RepID=UPI0022C2BE34|nr:virulence RhuM family protein [Flavobacterium sp.]MCZ8198568.1 virulence RhuM family protein [Flavobacterium sp.]